MPGARTLKMLTMKLSAPAVVDMPSRMMPSSQKSMFGPGEAGREVNGV